MGSAIRPRCSSETRPRKRFRHALVAILFFTGALATQAESTSAKAKAEIVDLLDLQSAAWTRGDVETFVSVYAEDAKFLSSTGLTTGRAEVLARYKRRYPDAAAMGRLRLEIEDFVAFTDDDGRVTGASVVARWFLSYPADAERQDIDGLTLLTFAPNGSRSRKDGSRKDGSREDGEPRWLIVHDASM